MDFTIVTRCNCGCETSDVIEVSASSAESAVGLLRSQWDEEERDVEVHAVFNGNPSQVAMAPE
jgi:hypothetical protein